MLKLQNLRNDATPYYFAVDIAMIVLVVVNLCWIVFDWVFAVPWVQSLLTWLYPPFVEFYGSTVHPNFYNIDLVFVAIFLTEFCAGWLLCAVKKRYDRWWFYPIFHWYDLLGCIPVGSFRFLRVLRLVSILVRLQRLGVIDLSNTALFQFFARYYRILVEEISDRVVVNVLEGVQEEVREGSPLQDRIVHEVLLPRQQVVAAEIVYRLEHTLQSLMRVHQPAVRRYIENLMVRAMEDNPELKLIGKLPILGDVVNHQLDSAVGDIVASVVESLVDDLSSQEFSALVENTVGTSLGQLTDEDPRDEGIDTLEVVDKVIELVKDQVKVQRWKEQV
ncbi:conserved hypothetical protein [gamma proteobacterium HTCC5015]|nr:conserved hypothetical protein [gamma proteobacterium HTCC5015]